MTTNLERRVWCLRALALGASALLPPESWCAAGRAIPTGYVTVGGEYSVPPAVLFGVALQESQRLFGQHALPWPWTLNIKGKAYRFPTQQATHSALRDALHHGISLVDIGLMQVCWHFHRERLRSPELALQPYWNLRVGASILRDHYRASNDWFTAVGHYHAPANAVRARRYAERVARHVQGLARA